MSERSDQQTALTTWVGDGGGCLQAAEAATQLRNQEPTYTRRSLLGAMAGLGATATVPRQEQTDTGPEAANPDNIEIVQTSGKLRTLWLKHAIEQDRVQLVGTAISDDGYTFYHEDAEVLYIRGRGVDNPFYTVYLHGENDADPENTTGLIVWSQNPEINTKAVAVAHVDHSGDSTNDHYQISQYHVRGGSLAVRSQVIENFGGCDNVNWRCVSRIAGSYAAMYGSCAICASSLTPPTCAVCLGAVGFHLASQHCPWCRD